MTDVMSPFASFRLNSSCPEWLSRALAAQLLSRAELCYDSALLFRHVGLCEPNPSSCLTNKQQIMLMAFTFFRGRRAYAEARISVGSCKKQHWAAVSLQSLLPGG